MSLFSLRRRGDRGYGSQMTDIKEFPATENMREVTEVRARCPRKGMFFLMSSCALSLGVTLSAGSNFGLGCQGYGRRVTQRHAYGCLWVNANGAYLPYIAFKAVW